MFLFRSEIHLLGWQDIWAKNYNEVDLRVTFEYLIQSELLWLNQDFKQFIAKQDLGNVRFENRYTQGPEIQFT